MAQVKKYLVTHPRGIDLGTGHHDEGDTIYEPWLDPDHGLSTYRLVHLGLIAQAGEVDEADVPDVSWDGVPPHHEADGGIRPVHPAPSVPSPVEPEDVREPDIRADFEAQAAKERSEIDAANDAEQSYRDAVVAALINGGSGEADTPEEQAAFDADVDAATKDAPDAMSDEELAVAVENWTVPQAVAYAAAHPDQIAAIAITELERGDKARSTLLASLEALTPKGE